jgi:hypothetical protein
MIGEEDGIPAVRLVFRPDNPSADLKIPEPSFSLLEVRFQDINRVFILAPAEVEIPGQSLGENSDFSVEDFPGKKPVKSPEEFILSVEITSVDQAGFDVEVRLSHPETFRDGS